MQDRYIGDAGDYGKYGLLRAVAATGLRLGVAWYATQLSGGGDGDGSRIQYLAAPDRFRECDPDLFDALSSLVRGQRRTISEVMGAGILPPSTLYHSEPLSFVRSEARRSRADRRDKWLGCLNRAVQPCNVVFADPDNGLQTASVGRLSLGGPRYAYYEDLRPMYERGQSLIVYQHATRRAPLEDQIRARMSELARELSCSAVWAARLSLFGSRYFLVASTAPHAPSAAAALDQLRASAWSNYFKVYQHSS